MDRDCPANGNAVTEETAPHLHVVPEPPATQCIGDFNRKQPQTLTDLYAGGVNSGRNAAPDVHSVAQNAEAHAHAAAAANGVIPPLSQPSKQGRKHMGMQAPSSPPSAALLLPHAPALAPPVWYPPHPTPGAQLTTPLAHFTWYPGSASAPYPPEVYMQNPYWPGYFRPPQSHP